MSQFLSFISFSGVLQGYALAIIFYFNRKGPYRWLATLFAIFSSVMLSIIITSNLEGEAPLLQLVEFGGTLLIGPLIYLLTAKLLRLATPSNSALVLHFLPFSIYVFFQILPHTRFFQIPIVLLLLHFQLYTAWLVYILVSTRSSRLKPENVTAWLLSVAAVLVIIHIAQWLRYIFSEFSGLKLLVPGVAFVAFYLFTLFGLSKSRLFDFARRGKNSTIEDQGEELKKKLERLVADKKIHTNCKLSVDSLAAEMDVMPYVLSQYINFFFSCNFNDFINSYRVETAKEYLVDPRNKNFTIEAIGKKAGFNSRSSFYAAFKKATGRTPSEFLSVRISKPGQTQAVQ